MHCGWVPAVDICVIGAKRRDLKLKALFQHDNHTKMRTDRVRARKKCLHGLRPRVSGDVVILWSQTSHHVAHAAAREVRYVPLLAQARRDFSRGLFHRRRFETRLRPRSLAATRRGFTFYVADAISSIHITTVAASSRISHA